jgi:hypothetical protein
MSIGKQLLTFQIIIVPSSSGSHRPSKQSPTFQRILTPEDGLSVTIYQSTQHNILEEFSPQQNAYENLKSHKIPFTCTALALSQCPCLSYPLLLTVLSCMTYSPNMMMEAAGSSETSIKIHHSTWHHTPEESDFQILQDWSGTPGIVFILNFVKIG